MATQVPSTTSSAAFDKAVAQANLHKMYEQKKKTCKDEYERAVSTQLDIQPNVNQFLADEVNFMRSQFAEVIKYHITMNDSFEKEATSHNETMKKLHQDWQNARLTLQTTNTQQIVINTTADDTDLDRTLQAWIREKERVTHEVDKPYSRLHIWITDDDKQLAKAIHDAAFSTASTASVAVATDAAPAAGSGAGAGAGATATATATPTPTPTAGSGSGSDADSGLKQAFEELRKKLTAGYVSNAINKLRSALSTASRALDAKNFFAALEIIENAYMAERQRFVQLMEFADYRELMFQMYKGTFAIMDAFVEYMNAELSVDDANLKKLSREQLEQWELGFNAGTGNIYGAYARLVEHMVGDIINDRAFKWQFQQEINAAFYPANTRVKAEIDALRQRVRAKIVTKMRQEAIAADKEEQAKYETLYAFKTAVGGAIDAINEIYSKHAYTIARGDRLFLRQDEIERLKLHDHDMIKANELITHATDATAVKDEEYAKMLKLFEDADKRYMQMAQLAKNKWDVSKATKDRWDYYYKTKPASYGGILRTPRLSTEAYFDDTVDVDADADADDAALDDDPFAHIHPAAAVV
jgi:hypothetical protein